MEIGTLLFIVGLAYGLGILWYSLLQGNVPDRVWRVAAYPFLGIWAAEGLLAPSLTFDPKFGEVHLLSAVIGSIVAVIVDWAITSMRKA
ncbi:MAG: hypothetical protein HYU86_02220 [Chloroflexi bacterium]|nr:hypothetical protein [Chloroflexota bacterium]